MSNRNIFMDMGADTEVELHLKSNAMSFSKLFGDGEKIKSEYLPENAGGGSVDLGPLEARVAALEKDFGVADTSHGEVPPKGFITVLREGVAQNISDIANHTRRIVALESRPVPEGVNLQPLTERVAALEGKENILGEDGKVKADLLPDSCKNEHCEAQPLPSDVVRTADIEDVVRKSALFDTTHNMILPELIPEAEVAVKWLKGKGRPDKPETTEGAIVGDEAECTRYLSTDGAGTGAWEWEKRGGVWHVVRGDTGWREFENPEKYLGKIKLRRTNDRISIEFGGGEWDYFGTVKLSQSAKIPNKGDDINGYRIELHQLSEGFRSCTNAINQIFDDETNAQVGMVLVGGVKDNLGMVDLRFAMTVNRETNFRSLRIGIVTFPTVDRWPETLGGVASESCPI